MHKHERRSSMIGEIVTAYSELQARFDAFIAEWHDTDKKVGVKAEKLPRSGNHLNLRLFDGADASVLFSMVINQNGDPWGKITFMAGATEIYAIYFDTRGYLHDKPQRNGDTMPPPLLSHPYQQNIIVAKFMEAYLETFREGRGGNK